MSNQYTWNARLGWIIPGLLFMAVALLLSGSAVTAQVGTVEENYFGRVTGLAASGNLEEAVRVGEGWLERSREEDGELSYQYALAANELGVVVGQSGQKARATDLYKEAVRAVAISRPASREESVFRSNFGGSLAATGQISEARTQFFAALGILAALPGDNSVGIHTMQEKINEIGSLEESSRIQESRSSERITKPVQNGASSPRMVAASAEVALARAAEAAARASHFAEKSEAVFRRIDGLAPEDFEKLLRALRSWDPDGDAAMDDFVELELKGGESFYDMYHDWEQDCFTRWDFQTPFVVPSKQLDNLEAAVDEGHPKAMGKLAAILSGASRTIVAKSDGDTNLVDYKRAADMAATLAVTGDSAQSRIGSFILQTMKAGNAAQRNAALGVDAK